MLSTTSANPAARSTETISPTGPRRPVLTLGLALVDASAWIRVSATLLNVRFPSDSDQTADIAGSLKCAKVGSQSACVFKPACHFLTFGLVLPVLPLYIIDLQ